LEVGGGVATEFGGLGGEDDIERGEAVADVEQTRDGEAVAAVVAFAAEDEDALFAEWGTFAFEDFDDGPGRQFLARVSELVVPQAAARRERRVRVSRGETGPLAQSRSSRE
jgi:hypothetical protein